MSLAVTPAEARARLLARPDVEAGIASIWEGRPRSKSLFLEETPEGFKLWCPPDPDRTTGDTAVAPRMVEVRLTPTDRGCRMVMRAKIQPAQRRGLALLAMVTVGVPLLWMALGVPWVMLPTLVFPVLVAWMVVAHQWKVARDQDRRAWDAVLEALAPSQLGLEDDGALVSYRRR